MSYIGRFAPSPTGDVHVGTLTAAVASFLHARQRGGDWLVRIEDIDPPREVPGSAKAILSTLQAMDLLWDGDVLFQSQRIDLYLSRAHALIAAGQAYHCDCSRQDIRSRTGGSRYPGTCRQRSLPPGDTAVRLRTDRAEITFEDRLHGEIRRNVEAEDGDFVIVRRDGLPAYHLAVVIDDADQRVTDIVRGADLLDSTPLHILLQQRLALPTPNYWHIPLITDAGGEKLSKSTGAEPVDTRNPSKTAATILRLLGLKLPDELEGARPSAQWQWAGPQLRIDTLVSRTYA